MAHHKLKLRFFISFKATPVLYLEVSPSSNFKKEINWGAGPMFQAWFTPPIVPLLKVYVFNITNKDEVLEGADPITEELGPYVYSATHIRSLVEVSYISFKVLYEILFFSTG